MSEIPARVVTGWWRTLAEHERRGNVCVRCGVHRCWPYSDAFAALVQLDLFHLGPPDRVKS